VPVLRSHRQISAMGKPTLFPALLIMGWMALPGFTKSSRITDEASKSRVRQLHPVASEWAHQGIANEVR